MGSVPILSIKWSISIGTIINFDGDGDGTCKQALNHTPNKSFQNGLQPQIDPECQRGRIVEADAQCRRALNWQIVV